RLSKPCNMTHGRSRRPLPTPKFGTRSTRSSCGPECKRLPSKRRSTPPHGRRTSSSQVSNSRGLSHNLLGIPCRRSPKRKRNRVSRIYPGRYTEKALLKDEAGANGGPCTEALKGT